MKNYHHPFFDQILHYQQIGSTFSKAEQLVRQGTAQGNFLLLADAQSNGRGRGEAVWYSPAGGIWLTMGIYGLPQVSGLTLFIGICLHRILTGLYPEISEQLLLKWPNDLYCEENKIGGILSEYLSSRKYHLVGIGLNTSLAVFPEELTETASSLQLALQRNISNREILDSFFTHFSTELPDFLESGLEVDYFQNHSLLTNLKIRLQTDFDQFTGICRGINREGALLLEIKPGMIQPFFAGSVVEFSKIKTGIEK
ncbi:MAG: biotin--[acetyl-CoA-carboxylase] ligase [Candidatus Cloacimonetes bacterium]|nr:biotin--[acetyl-CoA-carboxylase] ligase [Candidatus Cloacimonadota bacterium]